MSSCHFYFILFYFISFGVIGPHILRKHGLWALKWGDGGGLNLSSGYCISGCWVKPT